MSYKLFKQLTIWNWSSWFDVQAYNVIKSIMLLLALFRIWLSRFFAFIPVILYLTFGFFRLYSHYFAFDFRVFSPLFALFRIWLSRFSPLIALFRIWLLRFFRLWLSRFSAIHFRVYSPLFALFRIWLSRFFAFIRVISHLTFAFFRL